MKPLEDSANEGGLVTRMWPDMILVREPEFKIGEDAGVVIQAPLEDHQGDEQGIALQPSRIADRPSSHDGHEQKVMREPDKRGRELSRRGVAPGLVIRWNHSSSLRIAMKACCGISTLPSCFMRFLPSFCFSRSFLFLEMSPP